MNCLFAAQSQNIYIDACVVGCTSSVLQQAASLTKALYLELKEPSEILVTLLTVYLAGRYLQRVFT